MADGWRPERRKEGFTEVESEQLERAAKRIARAFGYGTAWRAPSWELAKGGEDGGDGGAYHGALPIAHRGHLTEQAARRIAGCGHVRRQHAWAKHGGVVAVPSAQPDPAGQAALSFAHLTGPLLPLLLAYSLESMPDWYRVEPFLHAARPSRNQVMAGRDAMARIMYAVSATSMDSRALQLRTNASAYRDETRGAEYQLRAWLLAASIRYNRAGNAYFQRIMPPQGNGFRRSQCWDKSQETYRPRK